MEQTLHLAAELIVVLAPVSIVAWLCWTYPEHWMLFKKSVRDAIDKLGGGGPPAYP